ncbi:MAG: excinuclease ABC subunit A, partial [Pseudobdellovibrionaceae bacterium]
MSDIHLWGVKQNNLKDIEVKVPIGSLTVVCGPSGSGKSSLAFQTLFAEGQRRFIESMSNYARQFLNKAPKPDIEGIANIPPAIAIEQKNSVKTSRSTVGTVTELVDYLRLLFEKIGQPYCPTHHIPTEKMSVTEATDRALKTFSGKRGYLLVEIPEIGRIAEGKKLHALLLQEGFLRIYLPPEEEGRAAAKGKAKKTTAKATAKKDLPLDRTSTNGTSKSTLGEVLDIGDAAALKKGLPQSTFYVVVDRLSFQKEDRSRLADSIGQAYEASLKFSQNVNGRRTTIITTEGERLDLSEEASCPLCHYTPPPLTSRLFSFNSPLGACPTCKGFGNILTLDEAKVVPNPNLSLAQGALHPFT